MMLKHSSLCHLIASLLPFQSNLSHIDSLLSFFPLEIDFQGPAGSGKSTYCQAIQEHCATLSKSRRRTVHVANLDPAADTFLYDLTFDVRDLISLEEVMEELGLGPNGGLVYCMEYLLENLDWLHDHLEEFGDDEYLLLDCPGQLELYTHVPVMRRIIDQMRMWGYETSMVAVFCIDATFMCDMSKFISGSLLSLSAMIALELPHINVMTKCDLMSEEEVERILDIQSARQLWDMEQERNSLLPLTQQAANAANTTRVAESGDPVDEPEQVGSDTEQPLPQPQQQAVDLVLLEEKRRKRHRLTEAICGLLDDWTMVSFIPLNITDDESLDHVLQTVDHAIHYGEDLEVRGADENDAGDDDR